MIKHDPRRIRQAFANVSNTLLALKDLREEARRLSVSVNRLKAQLDAVENEMTNAQGQLALEMSAGESDAEQS